MNIQAVKQYFINLLVCFSQFLNCLLLAGNPDQTISSRCWQNRDRAPWSVFRKTIDFFFSLLRLGENHCQKSYSVDCVNCQKLIGEKAS